MIACVSSTSRVATTARRLRFRATLGAALLVATVAVAGEAEGAGTAAGRSAATLPLAYASERGGPLFVRVRAGSRSWSIGSRGAMTVAPDWAPGGGALAVAVSDASAQDFDIGVVDARGGSIRRVTSGPAWDEEPSWSPDGKWIAFASDRDGDFEIYAVRPDGSGLRKLTNNRCDDTVPDWSPDGSRIVYESRLGGTPRIWTMRANGKRHRRLSRQPGSAPAWSPDGSTIVFQSADGVTSDIMAMTAGGKRLQRLTSTPHADETSPAWSPDGAFIAFVTDRDGDLDLFSMRADGSGLRGLVGGVWTDDTPAWRPTG